MIPLKALTSITFMLMIRRSSRKMVLIIIIMVMVSMLRQSVVGSNAYQQVFL
jgi:hypothetical protein